MLGIRGYIIIAFCLIVCTVVYAQSPSAVNIIPSSGDSIFSLVDNLPANIDLGQPGADRVWDFTSLQSPFVRTFVYQKGISENELMIEKADAAFHYIERDGKVYLSSIQNADPLRIGSKLELRCAPVLLEYNNPLLYNDASSEYSRLIGYIPWKEIPAQFYEDEYNIDDSVRIVLEINRDDAADAWGTLLMQNEIFDVIRVRRIEEQLLSVWTRNEQGRWVDISETLKSKLKAVVWNSISYSYLFLADGISGPIAEVYSDENDNVEKVIFSADPKYAKTISSRKRLRGVYVYPNPSFGNVRFEFFNLPLARYELSVFNLLGKKLWSTSEELKDSSVILSDLSFLKRGTYFYSLSDEKGKRIVTRRLMILKV